jgi:hypothetical protein
MARLIIKKDRERSVSRTGYETSRQYRRERRRELEKKHKMRSHD